MEVLGLIKNRLVSGFELFGRAFITFYHVLVAIFSGRIDTRELLTHSARISFDSISTVFMTTIALGVVIGVQLAPQFVSRGIGSNLGIMSAVSFTRELAPIIGSLMIATQYGAGIAAEIANMKITEQVDALKILKVHPIEYLVAPRFLAAIILSPVVVFLSALLGIFSTFFTSMVKENLSLSGFLNTIWSYYDVDDIFLCLFKASVFGGLMILIATSIGLATKGGAKEVGKATTLTVIVSFVTIVLVDFIIMAIYL